MEIAEAVTSSWLEEVLMIAPKIAEMMMPARKETKNSLLRTIKTVSALTPVSVSPNNTRPTSPTVTAKNSEKITQTIAIRVA